MRYVPILQITLAHSFYGDRAPAISVVPADSLAFDKDGLLLRQSGRRVTVVADEDAARPTTVELLLVADGPQVFQITEGAQWRAAPNLKIADGADQLRFTDLVADLPSMRLNRQERSQILASLEIDLQKSGLRSISLDFDAVQSLWTYHLTGARAETDLEVVDPTGETEFEDLGSRDLPDGTSARVLRSSNPLPARARPSSRFTLQRPGPFGPQTLIPVLPAAGTEFRPVSDPGAAASLQSDIFVTLW